MSILTVSYVNSVKRKVKRSRRHFCRQILALAVIPALFLSGVPGTGDERGGRTLCGLYGRAVLR